VFCGYVDRNWSCEGVVCLFVSNVNGTKKHVEDISVDAVSGCKICSVFFVIYNANYNINIFKRIKLSLSPLLQSGY
jgi:hypothetical protein